MDADVISCWKSPTSLGCDKNAFCIKMALAIPRRDLRASTLCEEEEGALGTLESPQDARQHPRESQDMGTKEVSAHQKKGIWRSIAKDVRTLGVSGRRRSHCRKRWEGMRRWAWKTAEAQLGVASQ
ncbi:hypothetical protein NDU88_005382 [Pleurodeles waltl]|uniref:Myb-like domain-containing protein n=1 Tax=Pleurodeles waltl TaxID=8319 RepID=A0AAV7RIX0_PLEWA|nr:hypothetical protein NDU88_005382 [Pleurodeles waltl]